MQSQAAAARKAEADAQRARAEAERAQKKKEARDLQRQRRQEMQRQKLAEKKAAEQAEAAAATAAAAVAVVDDLDDGSSMQNRLTQPLAQPFVPSGGSTSSTQQPRATAATFEPVAANQAPSYTPEVRIQPTESY